MSRSHLRRNLALTTAALTAGALAFALPRAEATGPAGVVQFPDCADCNFLIITQDVVRSQNTSAYGYERDTTPAMKRAAEKGVRFAHGYSPATWTVPSVGALLNLSTVLDNQLNYMWDPTYQSWNAISEHTTPIARVVAESGIESHGLIETDVLRPQLNIQRDFTKWDVYANRKQPVGDVIGRLDDLKTRDKRFFMYVHFRGAHVLLLPPTDYHGLFRQAPLVYPPKGFARKHITEGAEGGPNFIDAYDQTLRWYDDGVGKILAHLEQTGLGKKTYVLLTADHGSGLGDVKEYRWGYGPIAYEQVVNVPMVLMGPGLPQGLTVNDPVQQIDVAYTVLDAIGVKKKPEYHWRGSDLRATKPRFAVSWAVDRIELRDLKHKYVYQYAADTELVYAFPDEETPIQGSEVPDIELFRKAARLVVGQAKDLNAGGKQQSVETSEADIEILRALGYVE